MGKRRLAERLGQILSDDSLSGTVRVGPRQPVSCAREGQVPIIKRPALREETFAIANHLASALVQRKLPHRVRKHSGEDEKEAARVFYVAATRATHRLVILVSSRSTFAINLQSLTTQR